MLLLSWQGIVIGAHVHLPTGVSSATSAKHGSSRAPSKRPAPDDPATCPVCQAASISGHVLLPPAIDIRLPSFVTFWAAVPIAGGSLHHVVSHLWRSRAPPQVGSSLTI